MYGHGQPSNPYTIGGIAGMKGVSLLEIDHCYS